jgi:probable rRNA maturation factor
MIKLIKNRHKIDEKYFVSRLSELSRILDLKGDISIKLGSSQESQALNLEYLQKDYPTDVLSFPLQQQLPGGFYLGDIFICFPLAQEQAQKFDIPPNNELLRLMIHGILHLAGYDHEQDTGEMEKLQEKLLSELENLKP